MRLCMLMLVTAIVINSCAVASEPTTQPVAELRPDDTAVLNVALRDFATSEDLQALPKAEGEIIVLHEMTHPKDGFISEAQLNGESGEKKLPAEAVEDLRSRHRDGGELLSDFKPEEPHVIVRNIDRAFAGRAHRAVRIEEHFPGAKAYARIWLPGYTADGNRAVLRMTIGPTPHGATLTYILKREDDGNWRVEWREAKFYV